MEMFQNPLFLSPACGRRNKETPLFTQEISGCVLTEPAQHAATSPPCPPVSPGTGAPGWEGRHVSSERRTLCAEWRAPVGPLSHHGQRWQEMARNKIHSMGPQGSHMTKPLNSLSEETGRVHGRGPKDKGRAVPQPRFLARLRVRGQEWERSSQT